MQKRLHPANPVRQVALKQWGRPIAAFAWNSLLLAVGVLLGPEGSGILQDGEFTRFLLGSAACGLMFFLGAKAKLVHSKEELPLLRSDYGRFALTCALALLGLLAAGIEFGTAVWMAVLAGAAGIGPSLVRARLPEGERLHVLVAAGGVLLLTFLAGTDVSALELLRRCLYFSAAGLLILLVVQYQYEAFARALLRRLSPGTALIVLGTLLALLIWMGYVLGIPAPLAFFLGGQLIRRCPFSTSMFVHSLRLKSSSLAGLLVGIGALLEASHLGLGFLLVVGLFLLHLCSLWVSGALTRPSAVGMLSSCSAVPGIIPLLWLSVLYVSVLYVDAPGGTNLSSILFGAAAAYVVLSDLLNLWFVRPHHQFALIHSNRSSGSASFFSDAEGTTGLKLVEVAAGSTVDGARIRCTSFWPESRVYVHTVWRGDAVLDVSNSVVIHAGDSVLLSGAPERLVAMAPLFECSFSLRRNVG